VAYIVLNNETNGNTPDTDNHEQPLESDDEREAATHAFESISGDSDDSDNVKDLTNQDDIDSDSDTNPPSSDPVPRLASLRRTSIVNASPTVVSVPEPLPRIEASLPQNEEPSWRYVMHYICAECEKDVKITQGEPLRCKSCGTRMLWKKRTGRMIQFEAR
jgi:DNA-directed RNA polymerase I, II, and III subunit RPABC4